MTEEYIRYVQQVAYETDCISLNINIDDKESNGHVEVELGDVVADKNDAFKEINDELKREYLLTLIKRIKNLSAQKVLILRYGLDGSNEYRTLEEIGAMFNVTRERIRQLEVKGLNELRRIVKKMNLNYEDF